MSKKSPPTLGQSLLGTSPRRTRRKDSSSLNLVLVGLIGLIAYFLWNAPGGKSMLVLTGVLIAFAFFLRNALPKILKARKYRALKLDDVDGMPGHAFEHYVASLLAHQGYKTTVTKGSGDLGVDIVARKNGASFAVQCKRYSNDLSRDSVSDAVAGKMHYECGEAMVVTNRYFTSGAKQLAQSTGCHLIDRDQLAQWITSFRS